MRAPAIVYPHHQRGAALIVALLILVVLTLVGIGAMSSSGLELLMAGNTKLQGDALTQAENTLVAAESNLSAKVADAAPLNFAATNGYYHYVDKPMTADLSSPAWWKTAGTSAASADDGAYVVEYLGCQVPPGEPLNSCVSGTSGSAVHMHRITVHSVAQKGAERIVQSTYATLEAP